MVSHFACRQWPICYSRQGYSTSRRLFDELDGKDRGKDPASDANERVTFWSSIEGETIERSKDADWLS